MPHKIRHVLFSFRIYRGLRLRGSKCPITTLVKLLLLKNNVIGTDAQVVAKDKGVECVEKGVREALKYHITGSVHCAVDGDESGEYGGVAL